MSVDDLPRTRKSRTSVRSFRIERCTFSIPPTYAFAPLVTLPHRAVSLSLWTVRARGRQPSSSEEQSPRPQASEIRCRRQVGISRFSGARGCHAPNFSGFILSSLFSGTCGIAWRVRARGCGWGVLFRLESDPNRENGKAGEPAVPGMLRSGLPKMRDLRLCGPNRWGKSGPIEPTNRKTQRFPARKHAHRCSPSPAGRPTELTSAIPVPPR